MEAHDLPLKGIRIGDFGWVIAGPFATLLLGRMGAEVIRVEGISPPDQFRELGPFVEGHKTLNSSGLFSVMNAGKSSVTFQLNDPEQARLAREVALSCDVLIENLGVGRLARFGLGYESLAAERPDLVMVSLTGFGLSGPLASYKAYVTNILAYVGMTASLGYEGGPGRPPGANLSDYTSGVTAAFAALCGLRSAREHGRGVHIDLSMAEATLALMGPLLMDSLTTGAVPERRGNTFGDSAPCGVYRCSGGDKWVAICISDDDEWAALVDAMGRPAWALDPAFATHEGRAAQGAEIDAKLNAWTRAFESLPLVERLQQGGVPAVPASDPEDLVNNPQFRARGAIAPQDSDSIGPRLVPNLPWHFDSHPELDATIPRPPALGEHNREILSRLTTASDELIARLCEAADSTGFQLADTSG